MSDETAEATETDQVNTEQAEQAAGAPGTAPEPDTAEGQEQEEQQAEPTTEPPEEAKKKPTSRNQRRLRGLKNQIADLQQRLAQSEARQAEPAPAPKVDDYETEEAYEVARQDHTIDAKLNQRERTGLQQQISQAEQAERAAVAENYRERAAEFKRQYPDYDAVLDQGGGGTPAMLRAVENSEHGPAVAYYLGKNPGINAEIKNMDETSTILAIGQIVGQVAHSPPPKAQTTNAPPVHTPLAGLGSSDPIVDMAQMARDNPDEWRRRRDERKRQERVQARK